MQFIKFTIFAIHLFTAVSAGVAGTSTSFDLKLKKDADAGGSAESHRGVLVEEAHLEKRSCTNNGCTCAKGSAQGQYCGYCDQVTGKGSATLWGVNSFECNPSGGCCFYGYTSHCDSSSWSTWCPR
ncbi:uncharacterized protein K444DRAFT_662371 [Hyaloscypha bicolor E]|uniref:Uncharacterized protein n=1 Tax=Hyaloscypha bicolor E TaxID=1095630 RepID=A0A2J6TE14_9HELO|nr:uncharacterized protein K444DRAFT_662371 [Hyaloscypha bicolor E]PMD61242.1 hypothetical protein K444DRAFT_662371 [Hyaloscypha bicolor E]